MEWLAKLDGEIKEIEEIAGQLNLPEVNIIQQNEDFYIKSKDFKDLSEEEIFKCVNDIIKRLKGLVKLLFNHSLDIRVDCLVKINDDFHRTYFKVISGGISLQGKIEAVGGVQTNRGMFGTLSHQSDLQSGYVIAAKNEKVEEALQYFTEPSWGNLYKVYEIIEMDIGKEMQNYVSARKLEKFTMNAQKYRHASGRFCVPKKIMCEQEACQIIKTLLIKWMKSQSDST